MQLYALVDYDNVKQTQKEKSKDDVIENVAVIVESLSRIRKRAFPECGDVQVRFYGGWTDKNNDYTASGNWINLACANSRGRRNGARFSAEVASTLFDSGYSQIKGLYKDGGQKMVDTLLISDFLRLTISYGAAAIIYSDDEDMLPGLLAAHLFKRPACIVRKNNERDWMNHEIMAFHGISIESGRL